MSLTNGNRESNYAGTTRSFLTKNDVLISCGLYSGFYEATNEPKVSVLKFL